MYKCLHTYIYIYVYTYVYVYVSEYVFCTSVYIYTLHSIISRDSRFGLLGLAFWQSDALRAAFP